jgi:hypothetical protein
LRVAVPSIRSSAAAVIACAAALGFTASAHAESATLDTDGTIAWGGLKYTTEGYALATMTVSFPSKKRFSIYGVVRDVCPKDGNGAYVDVEHYISGPAGAYFTSHGTLGKDTNGCGGSSEQFAWSSGSIRYLAGVRVRVCERDADGGEHAIRKLACSEFYSFSNPRSRRR